MVEDRLQEPISRLDYDWYSSNENIAKVTSYGTVLALNVERDTEVSIYAINKVDPTIVYRKEITILKETSSGVGKVDLTGSYSINSRIFRYIHLTITE